jgi:hypothetical protein
MRRKFRTVLLLLFFIIFGSGRISLAGAQPTNCIPGDPDYNADLCAPIDGFVSVLLVVGAAYGVAKNRAAKKQEKDHHPIDSGSNL